MTFGTQTYGGSEYGGAGSSAPPPVGEEGFGVAASIAWGTAVGSKSSAHSATSSVVVAGGAEGGSARSGSAADGWSLIAPSAHGLIHEAWSGSGSSQGLWFSAATGAKQVSGASGGAVLGFGVAVGVEAPEIYGAGSATTSIHGVASGLKASSASLSSASTLYPKAVAEVVHAGAAAAATVGWARAFGAKEGTGAGSGLFVSWGGAGGETTASAPVVLTLALLQSSWTLDGLQSEVSIEAFEGRVAVSSTEAISRKVGSS